MKRVAFRTHHPRELPHPVHEGVVEVDAATRAELLQWGPTSNVTSLSWVDADPSAAAAVFDRVESVTDARFLAGDGGTYAFVDQERFEYDPALLTVIARSSVVFVPPVTFRADRTVRFRAVGESTHLSEFHDRLSDAADVRIERVREFRRGSTPVETTDRQREALAAAREVGYYDVPRTGTVEDVAAELDCARSTAGELLRKAEAKLVDGAVVDRS